ncbi:TPA: LamG domain-containing protein [Candidatus Poribacteria bacterium]|jgi:hypothetical protein|nr:LamG domain-containing protein [Candidatus Poribacteria bacterium]HIP08261.1 LamG domain-containing protein [Rhodospirillales bacterium]HIA67549.1 LamG domain-containing protein [Candidatus Poribacteria bacterium]HIB87417.1 LamG domain-containing protein [Candidatus Poribacteria bacterium]HIB99016.1 LamG domain-containing protein [Candidatus Poribacteria bacterium]
MLIKVKMKMKKILSFNVILTLIMALVVDAADPKDLIIHLPFEGDGKDVKDVSPNKFKGEVVGKAKSVEGVVGKALEFKGGAAKFDPLKFDAPKAMTIEFWFKPSETVKCGGRMDILYRKNGGGRPHITFCRGGVTFGHYFATKAVELEVRSTVLEFENKWYYYVATQTKKEAVLYIDGKVEGKADAGGDIRIDFPEHGMSIAEDSGGGTFFKGAVDEFKIWSVAFTAEEVTKAMEAALAVEPYNRLTTKWAAIKSD